MNYTESTVIRPLTGVQQPTHFGKYIVQDKIGEGAMGSVYKAYDPSIERIVAIKTISAGILLTDETGEFKERFLREVKAIGKINHSNIISIFDSGELEGNPFFVMEYVNGKELKEYLSNGSSISINNTHRLISQVLDALSYSHDCGIVHRDIKPSNIFIDNEGNVKVADFGIAKHSNSELTQCGSIMGTPSYMSPEQCQGKHVDHRSDIFSTAVVLYEMLTGEKCFTGSSSHTIMHKTISSTPEKPSKLNLHIPKALDRIILKALSKKPNDRFQTAIEFKDAINKVLDKKQCITKSNNFIKYTSLSIISSALFGLVFIVSNQNIDWKNITFTNIIKPSQDKQAAITQNDLTKSNKILRLLKVAKAHKLVGRYVAPQGSNAYATYKLILNMDPNNLDAKQGLQQVSDLLLNQIKSWVSKGNIDNATNEIKNALALFPNDRKYLKLLKVLNDTQINRT